jgi:hypothetical protein
MNTPEVKFAGVTPYLPEKKVYAVRVLQVTDPEG